MRRAHHQFGRVHQSGRVQLTVAALAIALLVGATLAPPAAAKIARPLKEMDAAAGVLQPGNITALVLAAIGRTGSTLISHLFGSIPGVFLIVEPYKNFLVINRSDQPNKRPPGAMPTLASLLDCSFAASHHMINSIAWPFLCMHSRVVDDAYAASFKERCLAGTAFGPDDAALIRSYCLRSSLRVVKTIRLAHVTEPTRRSLVGLGARSNFRVRVLHVIRHPFKVLTSQYDLGWHELVQFRSCNTWEPGCNYTREPTEFTAAQTEVLATHLAGVGRRVCHWLDNTTVAMRGIGLPVGSTAVLRYEDFAPPSTLAAFGAIAGFLQLEDTVLRRDVIADDIERTIQAKHAGFRVTGQEFRETQTAAAQQHGASQRRMAESDECRGLYANFSYAPWPA